MKKTVKNLSALTFVTILTMSFTNTEKEKKEVSEMVTKRRAKKIIHS